MVLFYLHFIFVTIGMHLCSSSICNRRTKMYDIRYITDGRTDRETDRRTYRYVLRAVKTPVWMSLNRTVVDTLCMC